MLMRPDHGFVQRYLTITATDVTRLRLPLIRPSVGISGNRVVRGTIPLRGLAVTLRAFDHSPYLSES